MSFYTGMVQPGSPRPLTPPARSPTNPVESYGFEEEDEENIRTPRRLSRITELTESEGGTEPGPERSRAQPMATPWTFDGAGTNAYAYGVPPPFGYPGAFYPGQGNVPGGFNAYNAYPGQPQPPAFQSSAPGPARYTSTFMAGGADSRFTASNPFLMSSSRRRKHRTSNSLPFPTTTPSSSEVSSAVAFSELLLELIRQLYFFALLRIPSLYFMRVSRLIEDANVSLPDILQMSAQRAADPASNGNMYTFTVLNYASPSALPPHILQFRTTWNSFIDNLMREWKTQNVVSGLLLSALLTMLQIDGAATDPVTRITALMSLVGTLVSLLFGSIYTVRFGTMRRMYKAACWAMDAQEGRRYVLWNVWILLAMPGVWLAWSMLSFIVCIMAFVWRTGAASESTASNGLTSNAALTMRVLVSVELFVAGLYLVLVLRTFATYGEVMDRTWRDKVLAAKNGDSKAPRSKQMQKEMPASDRERPRSSNSSRVSLGASDKSSSSSSSSSSSTQPQRGPLAPWYPGVNTINQPASGHAPIANAPWMPIPRNQSWGHETAVPPSIPAMLGHEPSPKIPAVKVVELGEYWTLLYPYDTSLKWRDISKKRWKRLATDLYSIATTYGFEPSTFDQILDLSEIARHIRRWNNNRPYTDPRSLEAVLCKEELRAAGGDPRTVYSVYIVDIDNRLPVTEQTLALPSRNPVLCARMTMIFLRDPVPNIGQNLPWSIEVEVPVDPDYNNAHARETEVGGGGNDADKRSWIEQAPLLRPGSQSSTSTPSIATSPGPLSSQQCLAIPLPPSPPPHDSRLPESPITDPSTTRHGVFFPKQTLHRAPWLTHSSDSELAANDQHDDPPGPFPVENVEEGGMKID